MSTLGRQARAEGFDLAGFGVRGLLLGGETFPETRRQKIEELWGVRGGSRNFYGRVQRVFVWRMGQC